MKTLVTVDSCCCGFFGLRIGTIWIAVIGIIFGTVVGSINYYFHTIPPISNPGLLDNFYLFVNRVCGWGNLATAMVSALLLYGAISRKSFYLLPWLLMYGISIVLVTLIFHILAIPLLFIFWWKFMLAFIIIESLIFVWGHFFVVVYSLYETLHKRERGIATRQDANIPLDGPHYMDITAVPVIMENDLDKV